MVKTRVANQQENSLIQQVKDLDTAIRELKTSPQFTEAKLYEYSSASSYDLTGSLPSSSGGGQLIAELIVTATSVDGSSFISTFTPELWIPNLSTPYHSTLVNDYLINYSQIITDDVTKTQYWFTIEADNAVSASTFYFKAHVYSTAPVTVTYARVV
jgi:hypothetical protein